MSPSSPASWGALQYWLEKVQRAPGHLEYLQVSFGWVELVQIKSGLFTQNGSDSLKCIAAQHCLSNWRRFFILFPENKTFFQIKLWLQWLKDYRTFPGLPLDPGCYGRSSLLWFWLCAPHSLPVLRSPRLYSQSNTRSSKEDIFYVLIVLDETAGGAAWPASGE